MRPGSCQQLEGEREQRVTGQDRGPLVEGLVDGRPAAAEIVVVHGRQVVVNQRIAVYAFERRRDLERGLCRDAEQARAFERQEGPQALAAAERGQPHGLDQAGGRAVLAAVVENGGQSRLDKRCRVH